MNFYKCLNCDDIVIKLGEKEALLKCCDERMKKLVSGEVEASLEKHIPVVTQKENAYYVSVGEEIHPMNDEHYIMWIAVEWMKGFSIQYLKPNEKPEAIFYGKEKPISIYAYCNIHGLWKQNM